jgi:hypothetical protein
MKSELGFIETKLWRHTMSASGKWGKEPLDFIFEL